MAWIEKFSGIRVEIPEDRHYEPRQHLWVRAEGSELAVGLTQPGLVLMGGIKDIAWLVGDGAHVAAGQDVVFAITGKILYLASPAAGTIRYNSDVKESAALVAAKPYSAGWLFKIGPVAGLRAALDKLEGYTSYMEHLKSTDGCRNPDGIKGGVSGICKAVYSGISEQKLGSSE